MGGAKGTLVGGALGDFLGAWSGTGTGSPWEVCGSGEVGLVLRKLIGSHGCWSGSGKAGERRRETGCVGTCLGKGQWASSAQCPEPCHGSHGQIGSRPRMSLGSWLGNWSQLLTPSFKSEGLEPHPRREQTIPALFPALGTGNPSYWSPGLCLACICAWACPLASAAPTQGPECQMPTPLESF